MNKNIRKSSGACFPPVLNEANQPIRGLSRRRDLFYARLSLPDLHGRKVQGGLSSVLGLDANYYHESGTFAGHRLAA